MEKTNGAHGVTIKGTREGVLVHVAPEPEYQTLDLLGHLKDKLAEGSSFFQDAELVLDLGMRPFQESEIHALRELLDTSGIRVKGILSDNPITKILAAGEGLALLGNGSIMGSRVRVDHPVKTQRLKSMDDPKREPKPERRAHSKDPALFLRKTLRNGQKAHYAGHITVIGDVNPGAEVVAAGNIVVFGSLRGVAHAGAEGNHNSIVAALELEPTQLRIAELIARAPEKETGAPTKPELARIIEGKIMIEEYKTR